MTTPPDDQPPKLAFIDTETTGLDPRRHEIWEVGLIMADQDGTERDEYVWQLPVDEAEADLIGMEIGMYRQRRWRDSDNASQATVDAAMAGTWPRGADTHVIVPDLDMDVWARKFSRLTWGAVLVGIVPSFDERRLHELLRRHGSIPAWHYQPICAETLAAGWLAGWVAGWVAGSDGPTSNEAAAIARSVPWNSGEISRMLDVDPPKDGEDRHTALGDARWAERLWRAVFAPPVVDRSVNRQADGMDLPEWAATDARHKAQDRAVDGIGDLPAEADAAGRAAGEDPPVRPFITDTI